MAPKQRLTIRVTSTTDLLALIPYLLGFQPDSSLVLVAVNDDGRLTNAARLTLPTVDEPLGPLHTALDQVATTITEHTGADVLLAGYGPAEQVELAVSAATVALTTARVADGRFWRLGCDDPNTCPPEGHPFDTTDSPVTATAVYAGLVALPDRDALAATLTPVPGPARDRMIAATVAACAFLTGLMDGAAPTGTSQHPDAALDTRVGRALQRAARTYLSHAQDSYRARQPVDDEHAATLTVLLQLPSLYDFAARQSTGERWQVEMWTDLVRRAEPEFTAAPATLLALAAIQAGNGALADIAVHRALDADPDDPFAQVLASAIAAGIDPHTVTALLAD
ncbi:MAG: hypothetical protein QOE61_3782 [Micromonosporaceae bacterium]|jgi:hypothetical protein|nr:hypothetical protein [Micromonosporaceae bacterium]